MPEETLKRRIFRLFADLLEYPRRDMAESARECEALIASKSAQAKAWVGKFRAFAEGTSLERMQEVYSSAFDLDAACHPYVGYHLLGENYKRSVFLLGLKERYRAQGFVAGENELPDHLAVLLRFLAACSSEDLTEELAGEALLPALEAMLKERKPADRSGQADGPAPSDCSENCGEIPEFKSAEEGKRQTRRTGPYRHLLKALSIVLQQQDPADREAKTHV